LPPVLDPMSDHSDHIGPIHSRNRDQPPLSGCQDVLENGCTRFVG
jgi:hypothetical protein